MHVQVLINGFWELFRLPIFSFTFLFAPAIAQKVSCGAIEVGLAHLLFHVRCVDQANVGFLQHFVGGGRIAAQAAKVAVKKARGAQIESLELGLATPLAGTRFSHCQVAQRHVCDQRCYSFASRWNFLASQNEIAAEIRKPIPRQPSTMPIRRGKSDALPKFANANPMPVNSSTTPVRTEFRMALFELVAVSAKLITYFCPAGDCTKSAKSFAEANLSSTCCCMAFRCLRRSVTVIRYRAYPKNAHIVSIMSHSLAWL